MSRVVIRVSDIALRGVLRLPEDVNLVAAGTEHFPASVPERADVLVLTMDMPGAPDDAVTADPVYTRISHVDPVRLDGFRWYAADGTEIRPQGDTEGM